MKLKITAIDPFSVKEERPRVAAPRDKQKVQPLTEAQREHEVKEEVRGDRLLNIIEAAQARSKKRRGSQDQRRRKAFDAYTLVLKGNRTLHDKGKKIDTRI